MFSWDYAVGLFIWLPIVMGAISTILVGYKTTASRKRMRNISFINLAIFCFGLLSFAWEGVICLTAKGQLLRWVCSLPISGMASGM